MHKWALQEGNQRQLKEDYFTKSTGLLRRSLETDLPMVRLSLLIPIDRTTKMDLFFQTQYISWKDLGCLRQRAPPKHHSATTSQISINAEALSLSPSTPLPLHHHPHSSLLCNLDSITNDNIIRLLIFIYSKIFTTMFMIGDPIMCE
jgi:hypothetical protein